MADQRKQCPYCGEEIAASAKKCRFCGEWLEESADSAKDISLQEVSAIGEPCAVSVNPSTNPVNNTVKTETSREQFLSTEEGKLVKQILDEKRQENEEIRAAQNEDNDQAAAVMTRLMVEVVAVVILSGMSMDWSWWEYILYSLSGIALLYAGRFMRGLVIVGVSMLWGLIGASLIMWAWTGFDEALTTIWMLADSATFFIVAFCVFLFSLYIHRRGFSEIDMTA